MFLEKCGKLFFLKMRPMFFFLLLVLPLIGAIFFLSLKSTSIQCLKERFQAALRKETLANERKQRRESFLTRYSNVTPYFLDQKIESLSLLEAERQKLISLLKHPAFPKSSAIQERLKFLEENRLTFSEEKIISTPIYHETEESLRNSAQIDEIDLKQMLANIEDRQIEHYKPDKNLRRPQILIKNLRLKKQETPLSQEVFEIEMDLLKREFIQP